MSAFLTPLEVSRLKRCHYATVGRALRSRQLVGQRISGRYYIAREEAERWHPRPVGNPPGPTMPEHELRTRAPGVFIAMSRRTIEALRKLAHPLPVSTWAREQLLTTPVRVTAPVPRGSSPRGPSGLHVRLNAGERSQLSRRAGKLPLGAWAYAVLVGFLE